MSTSLRKTILQRCLAVGCAALLAACASGPSKPVVDYKSDYDFTAVKTFAFYPASGEVSGDNPLQVSDMQRERIDRALAYALQNKGMQQVADGSAADLLVSWHLVTQNKTDVRTYDAPGFGVSFGYGRYGRYGMYNCWNCMSMGTEVSVQNYSQGTIIVDLIGPDLQRSVWRGTIQSRLDAKHGEEQSKYNAAATAMFAAFPP